MRLYHRIVQTEVGRPGWVLGHYDPLGSRPSHLDHVGSVQYPAVQRPLISVISPSFRHRNYLASTLTTIATQSFRNFEHIVVDGGSTDGTVEYLQGCENLRWLSEPDSGYVDAFHKGLTMARGEWIMQCCISDGLLVDDWFQQCLDVISRTPEVSLVWGLPRFLGQGGALGPIVYEDLFLDGRERHFRSDFLDWLTRGFVLPEGNLLVRKEVLEACFPSVQECTERPIDPWLEFNVRFRQTGYVTVGLPVVANYGREHADSNTAREFQDGKWMAMRESYNRQVAHARHLHLGLGRPKTFQGPDGQEIAIAAYTARERLNGLVWAGSDFVARRLRPVISRFGEPTRRRLRRARRTLIRPVKSKPPDPWT